MREKIAVIGLFAFGVLLLAITAFLFYQDRAPQDDSAASVYYLSPSGNDSNNGSSSSPWKTLAKAHSTIASGDTVILKDGVYSGYFSISKPNTTWRAQNKHKAILDGGFGPETLNGSWNNIVNAYNTACNVTDGRQVWSNILSVNANQITIDGLFLRNSCGRGILLANDVENISVLNSKIDWTMVAGFYVSGKSKNLQIIGNEITRISFNDEYAQRVAGYCQSKDTPPELKIKKYCVNISTHMSGENLVVRNNVIAFGRGEIAMTGARNLLFENNIVVANKNNYYSGWADGVTVRNNFFWNPDAQKNPGTHWEKSNNNENDWHMSSRNEKDDRWTEYASGLNNIKYYNNVIINNSVQFNGYHSIRDYGSDTTNLYFGHNTLVTGPETNDFFSITFGTKDGANKDALISGIIESNIFDVSKDPEASLKIQKSSNDKITFRNNLLPVSAPSSMRGSNDIYENDSGLINPNYKVDYKMPAVGAATVDMNALRNAVDIQFYMLKNNSAAINKGSKAGAVDGIQIPQEVRQVDYAGLARDVNPDIGAFEYGGVYNTSTPTPLVTATQAQASPTPTTNVGPSLTQTSTPPLTASNTPTPPIAGNICGKADIDGDGRFSIADFAEFAKSYGTGKNTCADKDVDYGPCGGRDVNKDGKLNIADFGSSGIGFAQRYYPKLSCAI